MSIYVKHGTIKSMKSSHLLSLAYSYEQQNRNFICLKPSTDTRDIGYIRSSDGKERECYMLGENDDLIELIRDHVEKYNIEYLDAIFIDECQWLSNENINQILWLSGELGFNFLCYGLYSDYKGNPFTATTMLMTFAKDVQEISATLCTYCRSKAKMNLRLDNGKPVFEGDSNIPDDDVTVSSYVPVCPNCFIKKLGENNN